MTTEASATSDVVTSSGPQSTALPLAPDELPYKPSWVDVLNDRIDRLPGPTWAAYAGLITVSVILTNVVVAASYEEPTLELYVLQSFWAVFLPATLWLVGYLARVAGDAFDAFRPVLTLDDDEAHRRRYELTVVPSRPAWIILALMAVSTPLYYLADPAGSAIEGLSPFGITARWASETFFGALVVILVLQSIRQLRAVGRVHAEATRVDLFRPAPLYAFSILTSRTAIVIALVFILPLPLAIQQGVNAITSISWATAGVLFALAVFVLPLRGMQKRIIAEKQRLQSEVGRRLESTIAAIHRSVDAGEVVEAGKMDDALHALLAERELVDRLPTLPWRPGTLGAVVSAMALPIALFLVQRGLNQLLG